MGVRKSAESMSCHAARVQELIDILRNLQGLLNDYGTGWFTESLEIRLRTVLAGENVDNPADALQAIEGTSALKSRMEDDVWRAPPRSPKPRIH